MGVLIKNEFYKLKREWFMVFLLLLSLLPILTGGAGAVFNNSTKSLADLFFFMNNQFSMFFPMVIFILIGSLFYQEYKNKTYINWITYGFSKKKLFLSKVAVSIVIGFGFAAVLFIAFGLLVAVLNGAGRLTGGVSLFLNLAIGFGIEAGVVVLITTCRGNRYQPEPQYHCNKRRRGYIWLCILPVHRFRKWFYHSGQLRISCVHVLLG